MAFAEAHRASRPLRSRLHAWPGVGAIDSSNAREWSAWRMPASLTVAAILALAPAVASAQQATAGPLQPTICMAEYESRIVELSQARQYTQALAVAGAFEAAAQSRFDADNACYARALAHRATFLQLL